MIDIAAREAAVLWPTYLRPQVEFVRGEGVVLWDVHGREYLDFLGGIAVVAAGHAHPKVVAAVAGQLATLGHTSNLYFTGPQVDLAERLVDRFGGGAKVFLSNSGAEANEAAIKVARRWAKASRGERAIGIVAAVGGFHGRTLGTLAATGKPSIREPFEPLPPGFSHVPFGDARALAAAIGTATAAVLLEPIQGEAGIRVPPDGYLAAAREITAEAGVLLIMDEIQSGMGRTGRFFAHQHAGIRPDVVTMAKALASGYPIGATIAVDEVSNELRDRVDSPGAELRGAGLWYALDLGEHAPASAREVALAALSRGLVVNPVTETALRLAPPLVIEEADIDEGLLRLAGALQEVGACR